MSSVTSTPDPVADILSCGMAYRQFAIDNPTLYSVMFDRVVADYRPTVDAHLLAGATLGLLATRLERAMTAGALRSSDPLPTAALVWATCHGVVSLELKEVGPTAIDWPDVYDRAMKMIITGLA